MPISDSGRTFGRMLGRSLKSDKTGTLLSRCHLEFDLVVLKEIFIMFLAPSTPGGSRGRVRTVTFFRKSEVLGRSRPGSGG